MSDRGYVTPGEAGLIVFITGSVIGTALITTAFFAEYYIQKNADSRHIGRESEMCVIRVEEQCGDDICRYSTSVPCAEIESLIKNAGGRK